MNELMSVWVKDVWMLGWMEMRRERAFHICPRLPSLFFSLSPPAHSVFLRYPGINLARVTGIFTAHPQLYASSSADRIYRKQRRDPPVIQATRPAD